MAGHGALADAAGADAAGGFGATEFSFAARIAMKHLGRASLPGHLDPAGSLTPLAAHPAFRPAFAGLCGHALSLSGDDIVALCRKPEGRLALLIVSAPDHEVTAAARLLATAVLHRSIVRLGLKADRQHAQAVLGADGFSFAVQEAPSLHAALGMLDATPSAWQAIAGAEPQTAIGLFEGFGRALLFGFVTAAAPQLSECLPAGPAHAHPKAAIAPAPIAAAHAPHIVKLMRRRSPQWAPIIA